MRVTPLMDQATNLLGGTVTWTLGDSDISFGGGGWLTPHDVDTNRESAGPDLLLGVGYAGFVLEGILLSHGRATVAARALVGAGNAKLRLPGVRSEIASDNFLVMEPEILVSFTLFPGFDARTGLGYRDVRGVEDLPGVRRGHLTGVTFGIYLSAGPF